MTELPATFGKYYLTDKLATGGMAEIYLGKILGPGGFEKQLVIKQIHPGLSDQRHFVDLFVAEAKILVSLTHGNIVPVYELGVVDDTYFIAMEYIDGPTLYRFTEAVVAAGARIAPPIAAWIAAEIVEGLDYAHRKGDGVIHRDLSPRNVMLSRDGEVKLVDFGIAVTVDNRGEPDGDGAPTGSFPYMSPEQVRRQRLTAASDLFSAGVLLWEMLTGRRLFARASPDDTLRAVLEAPIPAPSSIVPEVPARLDEVVARALARDVASRWPSAADALAPLKRYLYGLDPTPGPRDVAALVAQHCPPLRQASSSSSRDVGVTVVRSASEAARGPATVPVARPPVPDDVSRAGSSAEALGERTVPSPERTAPSAVPDTGAIGPSSSAPRGKRRGPTVREQTFATHVEFERVLLRATPLFAFPALSDADAAPATAVQTTPAPTDARASLATQTPSTDHAVPPAAGASVHDAAAVLPSAPDRRDPPPVVGPVTPTPAIRTTHRGRAVVLTLGAAAVLAAIAWPRLRGAVFETRPATVPDTTAVSGSAVPETRPVTVPDAAAGSETRPVTAPGTATVAEPRPAATAPGTAAAPNARPTIPVERAAPAARRGRLKVGASPWGEVSVDGRRLGRTPGTWELAVGAHEVEIVFPGTDVPQRKVFPVQVKPGEEVTLFAEFTP